MKLNILSYATGYTTKIYERFAGSLFDTGFNGKLYLFVHQQDLATLSKLDRFLLDKISIVECPERMSTDSETQATEIYIEQSIHPQNYRYLLYLGFLQQHKQPKNEYSLFCDARDVLFQKNPNEYHIDNNIDMLVFQEDIVINDCVFNKGFLESVKSKIPDGNYNYAANKAICSGTILVQNQSLYNFIVVFCKFMMDNHLNQSIITDQGLHTYLVYNNLYDCNYKIVTNEENLVKTVATMDCSKLKITDDNKIADENDIVPYIVHQYDRLDENILKQISIKYDFT